MDQHNIENLEDIGNALLNELGLSTLDEAMLPSQTYEGENHNYTFDKDTELSKSMSALSEEDDQRHQ